MAVGDGLDDRGAPAEEIEATHPQRGHFAVSDTGVGEEQNDQAEFTGRVSEVLDLVVGQVDVLGLGGPRQRRAVSGVAGEPPVADREPEDQ